VIQKKKSASSFSFGKNDCSVRNGGESVSNKTIQPKNQEVESESSSNSQLIYTPQSVLNTTRSRVFSKKTLGVELVFFTLAIIIPFSVYAGFFSTNTNDADITTELTSVSSSMQTGSILDLPVLTAVHNADPVGGRGGSDIYIEDGMALVSGGPVGEDIIETNKRSTGEISVYVVRTGDSLSQIAEMFGVTTNTILWANDINSASSIRPGDALIILPVAGVRHVVKSGDTLDSIIKKYEADREEVMDYNRLASAELTIGETLIIPGGAVQAAIPASTKSTSGSAAAASSAGSTLIHPAPGTIKTQGIHGYNAVDLAGAVGTPIRAAAAGEVIISRSSGWNGGYGNYIVIKHPNGAQTLYAHMSRNDVGVGAYVSQGQNIGAVGNTGRSTGPHVHFEVRGARNPF